MRIIGLIELVAVDVYCVTTQVAAAKAPASAAAQSTSVFGDRDDGTSSQTNATAPSACTVLPRSAKADSLFGEDNKLPVVVASKTKAKPVLLFEVNLKF
jgi:hypothetical protein